MRSAATVVLLLLAALAGAYAYLQPRMGDVAETWQARSNDIEIRVERRDEICWGICGAYYVFQSRAGMSPWRHIMTFRHDDPVPLTRDNVRFVGDRATYAFMGWMYAVTTDGGVTWSVWNAKTDLRGWRCCNYALIKDVLIEANGSGTMTLRPIEQRGEASPLHTTDFGRHWSAESGSAR